MSSVGVKGAESGGKERQIRRPFHPDVQFLRTQVYDFKFQKMCLIRSMGLGMSCRILADRGSLGELGPRQ
jgi:hypothetical protein